MKRLLILLLLLVPAQSWGWMGVHVAGSGVPVAAGGSYGEGDLLTERWGAQGTWSETTEGTATLTYNDTTYSGTGFVSSQFKTDTGTSSQGYVTKTLGSAASSVYFRFYYVCAAEGFADAQIENIFNLAPAAGNITNQDYLQIRLTQTGGQLMLRADFDEEEAFGTGSHTYNISTGTIYKIEGKVTDDGATGSVEWKVNGSSIGSATGHAGFGTVAIQNINIGISYGGGTLTQHFDTLDVHSSAYPTDS